MNPETNRRKDLIDIILEKQHLHWLKRYRENVDAMKVYGPESLPERDEQPAVHLPHENCPQENAPPVQPRKKNKLGDDLNNEVDPRIYETEYSKYKWHDLCPEHLRYRHHPLPQKFSTHLARAGMYRNFSLNTQIDRKFY